MLCSGASSIPWWHTWRQRRDGREIGGTTGLITSMSTLGCFRNAAHHLIMCIHCHGTSRKLEVPVIARSAEAKRQGLHLPRQPSFWRLVLELAPPAVVGLLMPLNVKLQSHKPCSCMFHHPKHTPYLAGELWFHRPS